MVLSNAERQKRFRERLKAAARGGDLGERARSAIDEAVAVVHAISARTNEALADEFSTVDELLAFLADPVAQRHNGHAATQLARMFGPTEEASADEAAILDRALGIVEAVSLRHVPLPKKASEVRR